MNNISIELESSELFQPNCTHWEGYKPCVVQKETKIPNCFGCDRFTPRMQYVDANEQTPFSPENFAKIKTLGIVEMGGLGSVLRTTAVSHAIRQINPDVRVKWFTHDRGKALLQYAPNVEPFEMEVDDCEEEVRDVDLLINYEMNESAGALTQIARKTAVFKSMQDGRFRPANEHANLFQRIQIDDPFRKESNLTMQELLLQSIGVNSEPEYDIELPIEKMEEGRQIYNEMFLDQRPTVGLVLGTSQKGRVKRWPVDNHIDLAVRLSNDYNVVVFNGPEDLDCREEYLASKKEIPNNVKLTNSDMEVGTYLALMSQMSSVVAGDTFGFHAARAVDVPVVALAGPMPHQEMEIGKRDRVIAPKLPCSPCFYRCHREIKGECMHRISVDEVYGLLKEIN